MLRRFLKHEATRGSILSIADQGIVSISNFLTGILVARAVGAEDFGVYSLLFAGLMVLAGAQNALITGPLRVLGVQSRGSGAYFKAQVRLQLMLSGVLATGAILVMSFGTHLSLTAIFTFAFCLIFFQLQELARIINLTKLTLKSLLIMDVFTNGLRIGLLLFMSMQGILTPISALLAIALSCVAGIAVYLGGHGVKGVATMSLSVVATENWGYGRWILLEGIAYTASTQAYLYFTALWVDKQSAGALNAVLSMLNMVNVLQLGVMAFAIPRARQKLMEYGYYVWRRWMLQVGFVLTVSTAFIMLLVTLFAKPLLVHLYTPFYGDYAYLLPVLASSYVLTALNSVLNAAFLTALLPKAGFMAKAVSGIVTLLLAYPVISKWGVAGAAAGLLATTATWSLVYFLYIYKGALNPEKIAKIISNTLATPIAGLKAK
jgi:O-antigen/teichoic acid export membrane protein